MRCSWMVGCGVVILVMDMGMDIHIRGDVCGRRFLGRIRRVPGVGGRGLDLRGG